MATSQGTDGAGLLTRRDFVRRAGELGFSAAAAASLYSLTGGSALALTNLEHTLTSQFNATSATSKAALALAKKYAGQTINFQAESGLQAATWKYIAPIWNKLTGTTLNVVEVGFANQYQKALSTKEAGAGGIDALYVAYDWLPDFDQAQVTMPIDGLIAKYMNTPQMQKELADIIPAAMIVNAEYGGKRWGFPIDGPEFTLFYRTDIFSDSKLQAAYKGQYGHALAPPTTWDEYGRIGAFLTKHLGPKVYGAVHQGQSGQAYLWFYQVFASLGGHYFDPGTMNALINGPTGQRAMTMLKSFFSFAPPGAQSWGPVEVWSTFLKGQLAMTVTWPPMGRLSAGYGSTSPLMSFVPVSRIRGKFAAAIPPGGTSEGATGYCIGVFADSKNPDLAFSLLMWATAPDIYLDLVSLPFTLLKPNRYSMFNSPVSKHLWPGADQYYSTLEQEIIHVSLDPKLFGSQRYNEALDQTCTTIYAGADVKKSLDACAAKWNSITDSVGRSRQKAAYADYLKEVAQVRTMAAGH